MLVLSDFFAYSSRQLYLESCLTTLKSFLYFLGSIEKFFNIKSSVNNVSSLVNMHFNMHVIQALAVHLIEFGLFLEAIVKQKKFMQKVSGLYSFIAAHSRLKAVAQYSPCF